MTAPVDVLAEAQAQIDEISARIANVRHELVMSRLPDKSHLRAKIKRLNAEREKIGRAALARCKGGAA